MSISLRLKFSKLNFLLSYWFCSMRKITKDANLWRKYSPYLLLSTAEFVMMGKMKLQKARHMKQLN
jgi:hypothetical protein